MRYCLVAVTWLGLAAGSLAFARDQLAPSGPAVPANLLRFELRLDQPLSQLDMRFVHLLDSSGRPVDDALLDLALPDKDGRGIAILMHPGRIKTGVGPNLAVGKALRPGENITLVIGDPRLARTISRSWHISAAINTPIVPARWAISLPVSGSREPLSIALPSAINASAVSLIAVAGDDGRRLSGKSVLGLGEMQWRFVPAKAWKSGRYQIRIHSTIEDPAGNRMCSAFEQPNQSAQRCDDDARINFQLAPRSVRGDS